MTDGLSDTGMTLPAWATKTTATEIGSKLFVRCVSGVRVVAVSPAEVTDPQVAQSAPGVCTILSGYVGSGSVYRQ